MRGAQDSNSDTHVWCGYCSQMIHADWWVKHRKPCRLAYQRPRVALVNLEEEEIAIGDLVDAVARVARTDGEQPVYILDMIGVHDDILAVSAEPITLSEVARMLEEGELDG